MSRLYVKNWGEFQHYSGRNPPWIKLHRKLLDDYEFQHLPIASRALAPMLWLLASESKDGSIDADISKLAFRLRTTDDEIREGLKPLIEKGFLETDSESLASGLQDACLETETETEKKTLSRKKPARPASSQDVVTVFDFWRQTMRHEKAVLDDKRRKLIKARLASGYNVEDLCKAIRGCSKSAWHMGANDRGMRYDGLDLILRNSEKVEQFMRYDDDPPRAMSKQDVIEAQGRRVVEEFVNGGSHA